MRRAILLFMLFGGLSVSQCYAQSRMDELLIVQSKISDEKQELQTFFAPTSAEQQISLRNVSFLDWHYSHDPAGTSQDLCTPLPQQVQLTRRRNATVRRVSMPAVYVQVSAQRSETEIKTALSRLRATFPSVLGTQRSVIRRANLVDKGPIIAPKSVRTAPHRPIKYATISRLPVASAFFNTIGTPILLEPSYIMCAAAKLREK